MDTFNARLRNIQLNNRKSIITILVALLAFASLLRLTGVVKPYQPNNGTATKANPIVIIGKKLQKLCPRDKLTGELKIDYQSPSFEEIARSNPYVTIGGRFTPADCVSEFSDPLAIIIPYRNRNVHLRALLHHLHPILQRQQLDYQIFVVEQAGNDTFNKALLMNIAYLEALKCRPDFSCFIFHDVDLFVEDDRALYRCHDLPFHLSEYIDKFNYQPFWGNDYVLYGGVVAIRRLIFEMVNGYSTVFFGWGGEDDEMHERLDTCGIGIDKPEPDSHYRFKMITHDRDQANPPNEDRVTLLDQTAKRMMFDGLNTLNYQLLSREFKSTHTHLLVSFTESEIYESVFGEPQMNFEKYAPGPGEEQHSFY